MLNSQPKQQLVVNGSKKVWHVIVSAFFLCALAPLSSYAITNWADGIAYGTNFGALATDPSITSITNGPGSLAIGFSNTTSITLNHQVNGSITVSNRFSNFTLTGTGSTVSNSQLAVLSVTGGTNLAITGGTYQGTSGTGGFVLPPTPGVPSVTNATSSAAFGALILGTEKVTISKASFSGATYSPTDSTSEGTDGILAANTSLIFTDDGSESSTLTGGNADSADTDSLGGAGLALFSSSLLASNGTFKGGSSGVAGSSSLGGDGIFATNSVLEIHGGTFTGGNAGSATTSQGGYGIFAIDSDIQIEGGEFTGGTAGNQAFFGLFSRATSNQSTSIELNGGTYNLIGFDGKGTQYLTAGTNLVVRDGVVLYEGTLVVTNEIDAPFQTNTIVGGTMQFANDFNLAQDGEFFISSHEGQIDFTNKNLNVSSGATLFFRATTNGTGMISGENISFETNSTVTVVNQLAGLSVGSSITSTVVSATSNLYVVTAGGTSNATLDNFVENVNIQTNSAERTGLAGIMIDGGDLRLRFTTKTLREYWSATGQLGTLADELDSIGLTEMLAIIDNINNPITSGAAVEQTYFTAINTFQTALHGLRAAAGQSEARSTEFRSQLGLIPLGARGPQRNNDLRGWAKYYAQYLSHDEQGLNDAYDTFLHGGVVGIDHSFGNLLLGISGGSGHYSTQFDNDAEETIIAYHGGAYGTYGGEHVYVDLGVAYGHNEVETKTATPFVLDGEFEAQMLSAYIGAGYDFIDERGGTVFTPEASIHYSMYEQDAYTETGTTAVPRSIEAFEADSLRSSLGLNLSMLNQQKLDTFGFKLDGRLHWMHEFNPEPGDVNFSLEGGSGTTYQLAYPTLDEDLFRVGIGCTFFNTMRNKPKNVLFRADFDELFGDGFNSHNVSAKIVYAF
jgi:hypothetical protein